MRKIDDLISSGTGYPSAALNVIMPIRGRTASKIHKRNQLFDSDVSKLQHMKYMYKQMCHESIVEKVSNLILFQVQGWLAYRSRGGAACRHTTQTKPNRTARFHNKQRKKVIMC